jgi:hypothetical protein
VLDVGGTCVDRRGSIVAAGAALDAPAPAFGPGTARAAS